VPWTELWNAVIRCQLGEGSKLPMDCYYPRHLVYRYDCLDNWLCSVCLYVVPLVKMTDIKMNNQSLGISHSTLNSNGVIVDSGTTLFVVNPAVMTVIQNYLQSLCSKVKLVGVCSVAFNQSIFNNNCFQVRSIWSPLGTDANNVSRS